MCQFLHLLYQGFAENYPSERCRVNPEWTPDELWTDKKQLYHAGDLLDAISHKEDEQKERLKERV